MTETLEFAEDHRRTKTNRNGDGVADTDDIGDLDAADVRAARLGSREAFDRVVLRHQQSVISAAVYFIGDYQDALEVAQETFLKAFRSLSGFRGHSSLRTWLLRITMNTARTLQARMRTKKRSSERTVSLSGDGRDDRDHSFDIPDGESTPDDLLRRKEVKEALEDAILGLAPEFREVIVLRDLSGESYEAISRELDLPLGTVKSKVHRARLQLRDTMRRYL